MGLDIIMYNQNSQRLGVVEFPEKLHNEIFQNSHYWASYSHLRKIADYYKTNTRLKETEIQLFITELMNIAPFLEQDVISSLSKLVEALQEQEVSFIHIGGD